MQPERLKQILLDHENWLKGNGGCPANLTRANLTRADLMVAKLLGANLRSANLRGANLRGANLLGANLTNANLLGADLTSADLTNANLMGADLTRADLTSANLTRANLMGANLMGALNVSPLVVAQTSILPQGNLIGWKQCKFGVIVKVLVPANAKRSNATGRKCRAEFVVVLEVYGRDEAFSIHDGVTRYRVGELVTCNSWNEDRWQECAGGIHFFITREEAEAYN